MNLIGQPERATQNRVVALFCGELGYRYLGDWTDRDDNSNIEESLLSPWLTRCGYSPAQISAALYRLRSSRSTMTWRRRFNASRRALAAWCLSRCARYWNLWRKNLDFSGT